MSEPDRVLAPLEEARGAIDQLESYATPQELAVALEAIGQAVERSLRQLLRRDASVPDATRLHVLDPGVVSLERVIVALRQQQRISLDAAHAVHELEQARQRAAAGEVRAADADQAAQAVRLLEHELRAGRGAAAADASLRASAHAAVTRGDLEVATHEVPPNEIRSWQRRGLLLALTLVVLALLTYVVLALLGRESALEQGVAAFEAGRMGVAEQQLRAALADDDANATASLYLGRLLRRQQRLPEAGDVLNAARKRHPRDADILRELGHLIARDLGRPAAAAEAYQRAVELEPEEAANWIALVQALRAAGDPTADLWLRRAPADVQAQLRRAPVPE
ncbi:MAG TPA: tetratricopeptide repeat protein [Longimicrobiales bacterium]|nr:tetratricopeptide repeat protein [Longimicrobiales bacterium]